MKRSSKKEKEQTEEETISSSSDESISDIELGLELFNMSPKDYHAIKMLLAQALDGSMLAEKGGKLVSPDITSLTRFVTGPLAEYLGSTAKPSEGEGEKGEEEDPVAMLSLVPLQWDASLGFDEKQMDISVDEIKKLAKSMVLLLKESARQSATLTKQQKKQVEVALESRSALIFSERFMNLSAEIVPAMYQQLLDDLPAAIDESVIFDPEWIFLWMPLFNEVAETSSKTKKRKKVEEEEKEVEKGFEYYYAEGELAEAMAEAFWDIKISSARMPDSRRAFGDRGIETARRVLLFSKNSFTSFVQQLPSFVSQ